MWMGGIATGTGVSSGDQQHACRKAGALLGALDPNLVLFEWLAETFERRACKLGEFIEEQHAAVSAREFAWAKRSAATQECLGRGRVMRRSKGWMHRELGNRSVQRLQTRELQGAFRRERRKELSELAREHALARARRALQKERVAARRGENRGMACLLLAPDLIESCAMGRR